MSIRCEEVVAALTSGWSIGRWQARRHAARCPRCAAARDELRQIADALADVAPLTDAQRRLWASAVADEIPTVPLWALWFRPRLAEVLAAVIVGAVGIWWTFRPVDRGPGPPAIVEIEPPAARERTARDMEGLRGRVVALAQELDDLRGRADLLDARKDVDALIARIAPKDASNGL